MVAMPQPAKPRNRRDERITVLETLLVDGKVKLDESVCRNLTKRWADSAEQPTAVRIRAGFLRRDPPLTDQELADLNDAEDVEISDYSRPELPRVPLLSQLAGRSKGIGLRLALTLLFLAQTRRPDERNPSAVLPLHHDDDRPHGLIDLIANKAVHRDDEDGGRFAAVTRDNRLRQIRGALKLLADEAIGMVELPSRGRGTRTMFRGVHLLTETGTATTVPPRYEPPTNRADTVDLPFEFWTNGWVHVLTNREIAMLLMLTDNQARTNPTEDTTGQQFDRWVSPKSRIVKYDLTRATWDTHRNLQEFGLIHTLVHENRRPDGTAIGGRQAGYTGPHRFRITPEGFKEPALRTVLPLVKNSDIDLTF